ncbi:MAG: 23S rRNA (adenine(2030)-N(6))-methyltransferase RlmJ [Ectothiorhodospiraceae bacterium]|nr:23S rRNA (adenine(2030)-N(6))-methyltransferase RlmJ [Chromatiales bacterium]MCP5153314.1 23S rRNA (adenine(2030)-N(6))-methyltransferase RlmJ [Ectothiorhodospiraceae bacterium]
MLSYRHQFHAGNFADVLKHALLARALVAMTRKDRPLLYLDTHAGIGDYDLEHPWARKNAEHAAGVWRVLGRDDAPEALAPWLDAVRAVNPDGGRRHYPGSARLAAHLLRPMDRLVLNDLGADDRATLTAQLGRDRRVEIRGEDWQQVLRAILPPRERRGLVLIDPPYDRGGDFARMVDGLHAAWRRFATGVLVVWYPQMDAGTVREMEQAVIERAIPRVLQVTLTVREPATARGMPGCGMLVVNPPYGLADEAPSWVEWLWRALAEPGEGGWQVRWLVPERPADSQAALPS